MIRALAFDFDGTLVDSVADLARAVDAMLNELGREPVGEAGVRRWIGNGIESLVQRALWRDMHGDAHEPELAVHALERFRFHYAQTLEQPQSPLYPGVRQVLNTLAQFGVPMALVTNKAERFTLPMLKQLKMDSYFQLVLSGDSLSEKKPHPAPLHEVMQQLSLEPHELLMVGDSKNDVLAARAADCPVVAFSYGYNHDEPIAQSQPDAVFDQFSQLLLWLDDNGVLARQDETLSRKFAANTADIQITE